MRKILFPIQKLAMVFFYFQLLFQVDKITYAILSLILMALSLYMEGARPYTPLLFLIIVLQMFDYLLPQVVIIILAGLIGAVLKMYDINVPVKGPYLMGHRYQNLEADQKPILMSIFYPTLTRTKKGEWIANKNYNKVLYEIFHVDPKAKRIPYRIFEFLVSYIHKIYMPSQQMSPYLSEVQINQMESNSSKMKENMHKVIVFSHGLGSHLNAYTSMFGSWASEGYTVVSLNHQHDQVCVDHRNQVQQNDHQAIRDFLYNIRHRDLQIRIKQVTKVVQQILKPDFMKNSLNIDIQVKQIILGGHSYGGSSAIATKAHLNKIFKQNPEKLNKISKVIALDPWLFPFTQQIYNNLKNQDLLLINSQFFFQEVPYIYNLEKHFVRLQQKNKKMKAFMIKGMDHTAQCDMAYVFGNILQFLGTIKLYRFTDRFMALNLIICQQFLQGKTKQEILEIANKYVQDKKMDLSKIQVKQQYRTTRLLTFGGPQRQKRQQIIDKI